MMKITNLRWPKSVYACVLMGVHVCLEEFILKYIFHLIFFILFLSYWRG